MSTILHHPDRREPLVRAAAVVVPLLLVSLLVLGTSRAAFTGEASAEGAWDTATVALSNDAPEGTVAFTSSSGLVPGDVVSGEVTVTYDGSAASVDIRLYGDGLAADDGLADELHLTISDGEAAYEGTLAEFAATDATDELLPWADAAPDDTRTYTIEVTLDADADNSVTDSSASVDLVWRATTNPTHGQAG